MTWSYGGTAGTVSSNLDLVRLRVGDTDPADPLLIDEEITAFLSSRQIVNASGTFVDVRRAAADSADAIAAKYARGYNFSTDGQSFNRSERVAHYVELAKDLRDRSGVESVVVKSPTATAYEDLLNLGA